MSTITVTDPQPEESSHSRYVVIFSDQAPAFTHVTGLVDLMTGDYADTVEAIVMVATDGTSASVAIDKEDGVWIVRCADEVVLETVEYDNDEIVYHALYVPGFSDDLVPGYSVESLRSH